MAFISFSKRLRIYLRDQFTCVYCKKAMNPLSIDLSLDHVNGKTSEEDYNLVTCCRSCNSKKGTTPPDEFLAKMTLKKRDENRLKELHKKPSYEVDKIIEAVIKNRGIGYQELIGNRRKRKLVLARIEIIKILREKGLTFAEIGKLLHRDHTTIIHHEDNRILSKKLS